MNVFHIGTLLFPWQADKRNGDLSYPELMKRGYRLIGGDRGDVLLGGYDVDETGTELVQVRLRTSLDVDNELARKIAIEVIEQAYDSVGTECVEHS